MFGTDVRSLAAFRIGVGTILLLDLFFRAMNLEAFYTDQGILPRYVRILHFEDVDPSGYRHAWSIHMLSGEAWAELALFGIAAVFAFWLLIGYRTRLSTIVSWAMLVSLDSRNPLLMDGGDSLFRSLLFWCMFVPLGATWSVDADRSGIQVDVSKRVVSPATFALMFQTCSMYWFSIFFKTHPVWVKDGLAVYYACHNDIFATGVARWLLGYPGLTKFLTIYTYVLEFIGPAFVFMPVWNSRFRMVAVVLFWLLHAGFYVCLDIGLFALICLVAWLPMLPGEFWDWIAGRMSGAFRGDAPTNATEQTLTTDHTFGHRLATALRKMGISFSKAEVPRLYLQPLGQCVVCASLVYMILWNIREIDMKRWEPRLLPRQWSVIGRATGLDQRWSMFAPIPSTEDGWYAMKGTLRNGEVVNLWQPDRDVPLTKPADVRATYVSQRWRKYLDTLKHDEMSLLRKHLSDWLQKRWNSRYAQGDPNREVVKIEIVFFLEQTPPPGMNVFETLEIAQWEWEYE